MFHSVRIFVVISEKSVNLGNIGYTFGFISN